MGRRADDPDVKASRNGNHPMSIDGIGRLLSGLPITYNGSKKKLFRWLASHVIPEIEGRDVAVDAFSGSGIVSTLLANSGLRVHACDALMSSYAMTVTLACNPGETLSDEDVDIVTSHRCVDGMLYEPGDGWLDGYGDIVDEFTGTFTRKEGLWVSRAKWKLDQLPIYERMIGYSALRGLTSIRPFGTPNGRSTFLHRIKQKDTYRDGCLGHYLNSSYEIEMDRWFRSYVGKFNSAVARLSGSRAGSVIAHREDAIDMLSRLPMDEVDVVYCDPPYGGPGCRDYSIDYALHEAVLGGHPIGASDFFTADGHAKNFSRMLDLIDSVPKIILSYNNKAWSDIGSISAMLQRRGYSVRVETTPFVHGKRTVSAFQNRVVENLIIATAER